MRLFIIVLFVMKKIKQSRKYPSDWNEQETVQIELIECGADTKSLQKYQNKKKYVATGIRR